MRGNIYKTATYGPTTIWILSPTRIDSLKKLRAWQAAQRANREHDKLGFLVLTIEEWAGLSEDLQEVLLEDSVNLTKRVRGE